jgi:hypothetical protein
MYPWPLGEFDYDMEVALQIAMNYLDRTRLIYGPDLPLRDPMRVIQFRETQSTAAMAIAMAWKRGVRHRIKLADIAIKAVEHKNEKPAFKYQGHG